MDEDELLDELLDDEELLDEVDDVELPEDPEDPDEPDEPDEVLLPPDDIEDTVVSAVVRSLESDVELLDMNVWRAPLCETYSYS